MTIANTDVTGKTFIIHVTGPVFDARGPAIITRFLEEAKATVADAGVNLIHQRLGDVLVNPTGLYESAIHTGRVAADVVISDLPVVYGPWLEGVSTRNETSRFKGYHTFRKITRDLQDIAPYIAQVVFQEHGYEEELNLL